MSALAGLIGKQRPPVQGNVISKMLAAMSRESDTTLNTRFLPGAGLELGWLSASGSNNECTFVSDRENTLFLLLRGELFSGDEIGTNGSCT
ncbi:MAG TPA: hypothetical protein VN039_17090, partial [Nitrospira sp.]|nr:hypothetical protein [Nitrospira sp.]